MADDKKTLKFQMMMSPAEAEVLDDWMFKNRMRSRAEAIRRLTQIGMTMDRRVMKMLEFTASGTVQKDYQQRKQRLKELAKEAPPSAQADIYEALAAMAEFELGILLQLYKMLIETWPIKTAIPMAEAATLRKEFEQKLDGLSPDQESEEILRMIGILSGRMKPSAESGEDP